MPSVEKSIVIDRSREEVWSFLTITENLPAFESQMTHVKQVTDGEVGLGTRWEGATNVLGRIIEWTIEVVEFDPPTRSRMKSVEGKLPFEITYALTPSGSGTHFTYRLEAESGLGGLFGKLTDPLVERAQARTVNTNLANLKELLEAED
ncbi:MAG TPA: SRPBCC family protein [Nocardioidaceae bacterium]|nr:SRPBCC family protein [Nocardioidaceae bacterium]